MLPLNEPIAQATSGWRTSAEECWAALRSSLQEQLCSVSLCSFPSSLLKHPGDRSPLKTTKATDLSRAFCLRNVTDSGQEINIYQMPVKLQLRFLSPYGINTIQKQGIRDVLLPLTPITQCNPQQPGREIKSPENQGLHRRQHQAHNQIQTTGGDRRLPSLPSLPHHFPPVITVAPCLFRSLPRLHTTSSSPVSLCSYRGYGNSYPHLLLDRPPRRLKPFTRRKSQYETQRCEPPQRSTVPCCWPSSSSSEGQAPAPFSRLN